MTDLNHHLDRPARQQVLLVLVDLAGRDHESLDWELAELRELVATAGGEVVAWVVQRRSKADAAFLVGKGKAQEIAELAAAHQAQVVIFNQQLSPAQVRNLEEVISLQVLDRNQLILDIFAQRAASNEGKLQVELAQLQYLLPRLTGKGAEMSRLAGGIGTRGPGETKLETDRRRIRRKIDLLKRELAEVARRREHQRKQRQKQGIPLVSLVGYTNAGKTSLLNALTAAGLPGEDKLFATLDPTIRQLNLPSGQRVLLSDTVGFIQHLPPQLINAFKATLEEIKQAVLILHVADVSHPRLEEQVATVRQILKEIDAHQVPEILVLNKVDRLPATDRAVQDTLAEIELLLTAGHQGGEVIAISARTGQNLDLLMERIEANLNQGLELVRAVIPYQQGHLLAYLKEKTTIHQLEYLPEGIQVELWADQEIKSRLAGFTK